MKKVAIVALKGGVGKSSMVAGLGSALVNKKFKVGFLDIDITGSNLFSALELPCSPKWGLDRTNEKIIVPEVNGYWLLTISSFVGDECAVLWESTHHNELAGVRDKLKDMIAKLDKPQQIEQVLRQVSREIDDVLASSKWRLVSELISDKIITWPVPLDFLIVDCPPSTSTELFSFLSQVKDLFGAVIVSQPAKISTIGLLRTIDLLRTKQIPIIGLVANQDGFLNRYGEIEYQFLSPRVDLRKVATKAKIPFLLSIPQSGDGRKLKPYFLELADKVIISTPVVLKEVTKLKKLKRELFKRIARRI